MRLVFWNSLATESVSASNEKRRALRSSKNQTDEALSIILSTHLMYCKVRSHNPKGVYARRKNLKKENLSFRSHILYPRFEHNYFTKLDDEEKGNIMNSLYRYKAIVRCTHLVASILEHGCKLSILRPLGA